eukprot:m.96794 g.96794  ORF g.96794 m.96794 type:complete len:422 (+) comp13562_c1_seq1:171-1436(+)
MARRTLAALACVAAACVYMILLEDFPAREWDGAEIAIQRNYPSLYKLPTNYDVQRLTIKWHPSSLLYFVPVVEVKVFTTEPPFPYYAKDMPLDSSEFYNSFPGSRIEFPYKLMHMSGLSFFSTMEGEGFGRSKGVGKPVTNFLYANGPVEDVLPPDMLQFVYNFTDFMIPNSSTDINIWFNLYNTSALVHYDTSHNFHIVLHGKKEFILIPPSGHEIGLFPALHPYYRQLQNCSDKELLKFPDVLNITVKAGETIFIPAYWFHRVSTPSSEGAVALNFWTHSSEFWIMEKAFNLKIPLESEWPRRRIQGVAVRYFTAILESSLDVVNQRATRSSLLKRYAYVIHPSPLPSCTCEQFGNTEMECTTAPSFEEDVVSFSSLMNKINNTDVRAIYLGNFAEHLARLVVEHISEVPKFIQCLASS